MTIIRVDKSAGRWEAIPLALLNDERLSWDSRGFAAWLTARHDSWEVYAGALPRLLNVGREKARRFIRELEGGGYLVRLRTHNADGTWTWRSTFSPIPSIDALAIDGKPVDGWPGDGSTADGQPVDIEKTRSTERSKTTTTEKKERQPSPGADIESGRPGDIEDVRGRSATADLLVPPLLGGDLQPSTDKILALCPLDQRQAVLDEVAGCQMRGRLRSPLGMLRALVDSALRGGFVPNAALDYRKSLQTPTAIQTSVVAVVAKEIVDPVKKAIRLQMLQELRDQTVARAAMPKIGRRSGAKETQP